MCILVRSVEAVGFAAFMNASMTIVSSEFKNHAGSVLAILKAATGAGSLMGPFLAGLLYDIGGFGLPFYCIAVLILLNAVIIYKFLPTLQSEKVCHKRTKNILDLTRSGLVVIPMICVFVGVCGIHFYMSVLATYLEPFGLSPSIVGAMYTIGSVFYVFLAPLWGYIIDIMDKQAILIVGGHFVGCFGWFICGPSPLLPFVPLTLWTVGIGVFIIGVSLGCLIIPPMKCMVYGAYELNYAAEPDTFALVSGLYNAMYALGGFVGPFIGGMLAQKYGLPPVFTGVGFINVFMFLLTLGFFSFRRATRHNKHVG